VANPKIVLGALNISADPHPPGVYRQLFTAVANRPVQIWGPDWGKISEPQDRETDPPSFYGRVLVWTEIDPRGRWINQDKNREATEEEKKNISIPENIDPNFRSFNFVFLERRHVLVIEYRNELGQHFGAQRAERFFTKLLSPEFLGDEAPEVAVTVVPSHEALEKIYQLPRLRRLEIFLQRPNPDDLADETNRVLDKLLRQGAKSQTLQLDKKAKVPKLTPDEETKTLATIAAENGYVSGEGREDAKSVLVSTKDHPKTVTLEVEGPASVATFFAGLRFFV
jgi:hypothetical protein